MQQINDLSVFEDEFRVLTGEVEPLKVLKPTGILDCFQTVAGIHSNLLDLGLTKLLKSNHAWVLARIKYDVIKQIPKESKIIVKTWPHPAGRFDFDRDYQILDHLGNVFVKGTSKWVIIDTKERKVVRSNYKYPCECIDDKLYDSFDKIKESFKEDYKILGTYTVREDETDVLGHMNNIRYADIIFKFYPFELKSLQIDYIKEIKAGETLIVKEKKEGSLIYLAGFVSDELRFVSKFNL